jgi:hypothetical protein
MKLFKQELKKIFRPLPILALAAFTALFAYTFLSAPYIQINEMHMTSDEIEMAADLKEIVGEPVTPEKLEAGLATLRERAESDLKENIAQCADIFDPLGVTDYQSLRALESKIFYNRMLEENPDIIEEIARGEADYGSYDPYDPGMDYTLTPDEQAYADNGIPEVAGVAGSPNVAMYVEGRDALVKNARHRIEFIDDSLAGSYARYDEFKKTFDERSDWLTSNPSGRSHIKEILNGGEMMNIMPMHAFFPFTGLVFVMLAILILCSICVFLAPVVTRDNMAGVRALQYASKAGRRALAVQFRAIFLSATMIAAVDIAVVCAIYLRGAWGSFLDSGLHSLFNLYSFSWFGGTFGQWLACCAALILAISLAATFFVFLISKISGNYIALLLRVAPTLAALIFICVFLFAQPFGIDGNQAMYSYLPIPFAEAYVCGALLIGGGAATALMLKRQKRAEIY